LRDNHQLITNLEETFPILQKEILGFKKYRRKWIKNRRDVIKRIK
jgi:hypothetical protein